MKKKILALLLMLACLLSLAACTRTPSVGATSPQLLKASIAAWDQADGDSPYVQLTLTFDRAVSVTSAQGEALCLTVAGEQMPELALQSGEDAKTVLITAPVTVANDGVLSLSRAESADVISDICSADGKAAAAGFEVKGLIPSGVTLETVTSRTGRVVKEVTSGWNICGTAWVGLYEDGVLVPVSGTGGQEELDGCAAIHSDELLNDDETDIAAKIAEVLSDNYGEEYTFSSSGARVTAVKDGGEETLDIRLYQYVSVNGKRTDLTETGGTQDAGGEDMQDGGETESKAAVEDREPTAEEQSLLSRLRTSRLTGEAGEDATALYQTLTITGESMPETQIYSVHDLEELLRLCYVNSDMNALGLTANAGGFYGLDFTAFLALCGVDTAQQDVTVLCQAQSGMETAVALADCVREGVTAVLALAGESGPLELSAPFCLVLSENGEIQNIANLARLTVGPGESPADPEYGLHNYGSYTSSAGLTFTVEVYKEGAEYLGALKTAAFTTAELETLMQEHPEAVAGGYYGTTGDQDSADTGIGGSLDYFEGLELSWLLTEQMGLDSLSGRAEFYDRSGKLYTKVDDLAYFAQAGASPEQYYTMTASGLRINGSIPLIGLIKNGAPILADSSAGGNGYIPYSSLNDNLAAAGVPTEVGAIRNYNGPFAACLGNRSGYYGGDGVETGGNCVLMQIYLK